MLTSSQSVFLSRDVVRLDHILTPLDTMGSTAWKLIHELDRSSFSSTSLRYWTCCVLESGQAHYFCSACLLGPPALQETSVKERVQLVQAFLGNNQTNIMAVVLALQVLFNYTVESELAKQKCTNRYLYQWWLEINNVELRWRVNAPIPGLTDIIRVKRTISQVPESSV